MTYETFKNELKLFLEGRLGSNASVFYQRDTILGNLTDAIHIRTGKSGSHYSASMETLYHLASISGLGVKETADMLLELLKGLPTNAPLNTSCIIYQLSNRSNVDTLLERIPHIPFYDMEITFACVVENTEKIRKRMLINNEMMEQNRLSLQQLSDLAHRNTFRMFPCKAELLQDYYWKQLLSDPDTTGEEFLMAAETYRSWENFPHTYRLSAGDYRFGGVAILNSGYLKSLARKEGYDLLLLPCTEEDFVVAPWVANMDIHATKEIVREALRVDPDSVLTQNIFCYCKDTEPIPQPPKSRSALRASWPASFGREFPPFICTGAN